MKDVFDFIDCEIICFFDFLRVVYDVMSVVVECYGVG